MIKDNNERIKSSKGNNPFTVPENYFEDFDSKLMERINIEEGNIKVPVIKMIKPYLYIAASFLVMFMVGKFVITNFSNPVEKDLADNTLTFEQEMELIYSEVDDFTITDYLLENELNEDTTEE